jgi:hypothetical protein
MVYVLLTALPCMLMMFKCLNCGTRRSMERAVSVEQAKDQV